MAEGLARDIFGDAVRVQSAGSQPSQVNPMAIAAMAELGITLDSHRSKSVDAIDPSTVDTVVTLCAEEVCPAFLGRARQLHWAFSDPASDDEAPREELLERFREVRDGISEKLRDAGFNGLFSSVSGNT